MKKGLRLLLGAAVVCVLSGCETRDFRELLPQVQDVPQVSEAPKAERVYIDEVRGTLEDFSGNQITLLTEEQEMYTFDVSGASLECKAGMIVGDEVSVIYEGQLSGTDTSHARALKVVDEVHKKEDIQQQTVQGTIEALSSNAVTIKDDSNQTVTYPITGAEQYYQQGVKKGTRVFLHYKGRNVAQGESKVLDATHLKVMSISDIEPMNPAPPDPTPIPVLKKEGEAETDRGCLGGTLVRVTNEILEITPDGISSQKKISMENARVHFYGGMAPGVHVTVWYDGEAGKEDAVLLAKAVYEDNPAALRETEIQSSVTGAVSTVTANTVTIQTDDGVPVTCDITGARNRTAGGITPGGRITVIFDPVKSKETNIYVALAVADA